MQGHVVDCALEDMDVVGCNLYLPLEDVMVLPRHVDVVEPQRQPEHSLPVDIGGEAAERPLGGRVGHHDVGPREVQALRIDGVDGRVEDGGGQGQLAVRRDGEDPAVDGRSLPRDIQGDGSDGQPEGDDPGRVRTTAAQGLAREGVDRRGHGALEVGAHGIDHMHIEVVHHGLHDQDVVGVHGHVAFQHEDVRPCHAGGVGGQGHPEDDAALRAGDLGAEGLSGGVLEGDDGVQEWLAPRIKDHHRHPVHGTHYH